MTSEEFNKLKVGDLIEWNNTVTTDPNYFGVITQSHTFRNGNPQTMKFHQILVKWNNHDDICAYQEFDLHTLNLMTLIATTKNENNK
jgi:hypothetical protein